MTMPVQVITSVQRRRQWSLAEKERIVAAALEPGAVASAVARRAGIHTSQLFRWRRQLCGPAQPAAGFAAVTIAAAPSATRLELACTAGVIEVEFAAARVRISGTVDAATAAAVIGALVSRR